jgi:hypothetical protein
MSFSLANSIAELHIHYRRNEEHNRYRDKNQVLQGTTSANPSTRLNAQNFAIVSRSIKESFRHQDETDFHRQPFRFSQGLLPPHLITFAAA